MPNYELTVTGTSGTPVLLLPGGAANSHDFYPGLRELLLDHRVVELDRPGTGRAVGKGIATLPTGSAACAEALRALDAGPAVVVGQSLGGAVAVQVATDHPELVSGLFLLDPTPLDAAEDLAKARKLFALFDLPSRVPVIGGRLDRAFWTLAMAKSGAAPGTEKAQAAMRAVSFGDTAKALATFAQEAEALLPRISRFDGPAVLFTADRPTDHKVRLSHLALAERMGARVETWADAVHAEHLRKPAEINALITQVVAEANRVAR